jgi:uncharacterized OB-fold protein
MVTGNKKQIPVLEGLWTTPSSPEEKPQLIGCRCPSCGEVVFPKNTVCVNCQHPTMDEIKLSRRGKIFSLSTVMLAPPKYYSGPVPYAIGYVELSDGIRILAPFSGDPELLKVGMEVELVIEKVHEDDNGSELMGFKFRPIGV